MLYFNSGSESTSLTKKQIQDAVISAIEATGVRSKILVVPPDITRIHSGAGQITEMIWDHYRNMVTDILPALGTHKPMSRNEIIRMFGRTPLSLFREHNWRKDIITLGEVPGSFVAKVSEGKLDYSWPVQINKLIEQFRNDLIISIGQVVPHEVIGMANFNKNIFIGCGGPEAINRSHFLGAVYGMERIMGKAINPVREVLNFGAGAYAGHLNILYILTVIDTDIDGSLVTRGLYIGTDPECFLNAARLSAEINFEIFDKPLRNVVVYLDPVEYKSTWLGNKAIYRTRMAMADNGNLTIIGPGVKRFGEDNEIDRLIRKYGYRQATEILSLTRSDIELKKNLSVAAHLIHGSPESRFTVTYSPGKLSRQDIENVGFRYTPLDETIIKYNPDKLKDGINILPGGEEIFYISNPAMGLWATKERLI